MVKHTFTYPLAETIYQISTKSEYLYKMLNKYPHSFNSKKPGKINIQINIDELNSPNMEVVGDCCGSINYQNKENFPKIIFFIKFLLQFFFIKKRVLFLHASSFVKNGVAFVFCGPPGIGKSTILKKVPKKSRLNDDTTIIQKIGRDVYVIPSPFEKKVFPKKIPLKTIFILRQSSRTKIKNIPFVKKFESLLSNTVFFQYFFIDKSLTPYDKTKGYPFSSQMSKKTIELGKLVCSCVLELVAVTGIAVLENKKYDDIYSLV